MPRNKTWKNPTSLFGLCLAFLTLALVLIFLADHTQIGWIFPTFLVSCLLYIAPEITDPHWTRPIQNAAKGALPG